MDAGAKLLLIGFVVFSLSTSSVCMGQDYEPLTDEEKETLAFALEQANAAIAVLGTRVRECSEARQGKVLDPVLFKGVSLTEEEWTNALSVLYHRAEGRCLDQGGVHHRALVAIMQFKATEKSRTGKNATQTHNPDLICCISGMFLSRNEMQYSKLDVKVRRRLEAIHGINEPFDLGRTVDALRAVNRPPIP